MSDIANYQQEDNFETRLASKAATSDTTIEVQTSVSFTFSAPFYISVNPGSSNYEPMLVTGVSGTTWTVTRAVARYTGDSGSAKTHPAGTKVIISNNQQVFQDIVTAVNDKVDIGGDTMTGLLQFSGTGHAGLQVNSLTTAQRTALTGANGMLVYDTDLGLFYQYKGGAWASVDTGTTTPNASQTVAGVVEIATDAEVAAGTDTGGSGATLAVKPSQVPTLANQETFTAGEALAANVPACQSSTADEIVNLFLAGAGTKADFDTGTVTYVSACSPDTNKVAVVYVETSGLSLVAGTVTGSTVSWGTPQTIQAGAAAHIDICTIDTDKVAVVYRDEADSNKGQCVIATLSGTTFTIGSETTFETDAVLYCSVAKIDTDKILVSYYDATNTQGESIAATVSSTTPTFGSAVAFETDVIDTAVSSCQLDTDKALVAWNDTTNGTAEVRVATITSTSVSFSAAAVTVDGTLTTTNICVDQLTTDKAILTYIAGNDVYGLVVTVSGSTPTAQTQIIVSDDTTVEGAAASRGPRFCVALDSTTAAVAYTDGTSTFYAFIEISSNTVTARGSIDTGEGDGDYYGVSAVGDGDRIMIAFDDDDDSSDGTGLICANKGNADSYVGITTGSIAAANTGTVQKEGDLTGFSGLTAGVVYFGTYNGVTISPTDVFVGVATDTDEIVLSHSDGSRVEKGLFNAKGSMVVSHAAGDVLELPVGDSDAYLVARPDKPNGVAWVDYDRYYLPLTNWIDTDVGTGTKTDSGGYITFNTGSNSADREGKIRNILRGDSTDGLMQFDDFENGKKVIFEQYVRWDASSPADTEVRLGFGRVNQASAETASEPVAKFFINDAQPTIVWNDDAGSANTANVSITELNQSNHFKIEWIPGVSLVFTINGAIVGTKTTDIPTNTTAEDIRFFCTLITTTTSGAIATFGAEPIILIEK